MQYTYATSAYHEAKFLAHFHLAIRANFERGENHTSVSLNPPSTSKANRRSTNWYLLSFLLIQTWFYYIQLSFFTYHEVELSQKYP